MSSREAPWKGRDLPAVLPVFPLSGVLLLPRGHLPLHIFEPRYRAMTDAALAGERLIGMVQPRTPEEGILADTVAVYRIGCAGRIVSFSETDDGRYLVTLRGVCRFAIVDELPIVDGFRRVQADFDAYRSDLDPVASTPFDRVRLVEAVRVFVRQQRLEADWSAVENASDEALVTAVAMSCPFAPSEKQALLECGDFAARAQMLIALLEMAERQGDAPSTTVPH